MDKKGKKANSKKIFLMMFILIRCNFYPFKQAKGNDVVGVGPYWIFSTSYTYIVPIAFSPSIWEASRTGKTIWPNSNQFATFMVMRPQKVAQ